jgi:hypothetical protein
LAVSYCQNCQFWSSEVENDSGGEKKQGNENYGMDSKCQSTSKSAVALGKQFEQQLNGLQ